MKIEISMALWNATFYLGNWSDIQIGSILIVFSESWINPLKTIFEIVSSNPVEFNGKMQEPNRLDPVRLQRLPAFKIIPRLIERKPKIKIDVEIEIETRKLESKLENKLQK